MVDVTNGGDPTSGQAFARAGRDAARQDAVRQDAGSDYRMSRAGMDYTPLKRLGAFKAAGRHTARVKFLRRAMIFGAVFSVSIIAIVVAFDPFRHLPKGISIGGVGVEGTKVTMDSPKISGVQQGGGPYDVAARTGIQDITVPGVIELVDVDAHIGMADATTTHVLAEHGLYNNKLDTMKLAGNVRIANTSGYTFGLKSALVDFKRGSFTSEERTRVDLKGGNVLADALTISNNGHTIVFQGHVQSTFEAPEEPEETASAAPPSDPIGVLIGEDAK